MSFVFLFLLTFLLTFVLTVTLTRILLPFLRRHHVGQRILEIGPAWHRPKEGTPTMGGAAFILAAALSLLVAGGLLAQELPSLFWRPLLFSFLYALANASVGILDDLTKFRKSQNEGLTPSEKLVLQITFAAAYIALLRIYGYIDTSLYIPYFDTVLELGYGYYILAILLSVGVVNFVNLSDGIDGLAATTSMIVAAFFVGAATYLTEPTALLFGTAMMGAALGFLLFNRHPARIFMGDTGSLFLGAMAVGCAFLIGNPLIVLVAGLVYLLEGVSVVLQVGWFKISGKRLFRMAPFHHHLEKCGWGETRIVLFFSLLALLGVVLAIFGIGG
jgi:phospho-N-acetylmuramoyl-pentapeptide-transferase